jgi:hypothetical protein
MSKVLPLDDNLWFWNVPLKYRNKHSSKNKRKAFDVKQIGFHKPTNNDNISSQNRSYSTYLYKKRFIVHSEQAGKNTKVFSIPPNPKRPIHRLEISGNLKNLKKIILPEKLLWVFEIETMPDDWHPSLDEFPTTIRSFKFHWAGFPFNGKDITRFKDLKVIECNGSAVSKMPKFPKSIEFITFIGSSLTSSEFAKLKIKDYPNLKWLDVRASGVNSTEIPDDWVKAKKDKKVEIFWGFPKSLENMII